MILRAICIPATAASRSVRADRKFGRIAGSAPGVADLMWIDPRENRAALAENTVMPGSVSSIRFLPTS